MRKYVYTADDEFPDCMQCDNVNHDFVMVNGVKKDYCSEYCGAEKAWSRYTRTEYIKETNDI